VKISSYLFSVLLFSQDWEAPPWPRRWNEHAVQRPPARHHLQPVPAALRCRQRVALCTTAGSHHLCLPGTRLRLAQLACLTLEGNCFLYGQMFKCVLNQPVMSVLKLGKLWHVAF